MAQNIPTQYGPPTAFVAMTTVENTHMFVRKDAVAAYGNAPEGYAGNSWVVLYGANDARYVLETMDELTALLQ